MKKSIGAPKWVQIKRISDTSLQLTWKQVANAKGYQIDHYDEKKNTYKKVKTIRQAETTIWTHETLKTNSLCHDRIKAYQSVKGRRSFSGYSYTVSAVTCSPNSIGMNAEHVKVSKRHVTLGPLTTRKVRANVQPNEFGKARNKKPISKKIRWASSNTKLATVDQNGIIRAKTSVGTCFIYAIAHNGNRSRIKVTIKVK